MTREEQIQVLETTLDLGGRNVTLHAEFVYRNVSGLMEVPSDGKEGQNQYA